jgi:hypothetical protein
MHYTVYLISIRFIRLIRTYIEIDIEMNNDLIEPVVTSRCTEYHRRTVWS